MPSLPFATFLIVCPTSFFLGILFALFPYDYPLLWASVPPPLSHYDTLETHLKLLFHSPPLIVRILHTVLGVGLLGLLAKLYKPSESNFLFDGGSLVLYMVAVIVYITNTIAGLRMVEAGLYGVGIVTAGAKDRSGAELDGSEVKGDQVMGREDNLKVLSASNTIMALLLVGVLVLQAGQWYAERADERERRKIREQERVKEKEEGAATGSAAGGAGATVRRGGSGREGKKAR